MASDYSIRVSAIVACCMVILLLIVSCVWEFRKFFKIRHSQGNEMPHILEDPSTSNPNIELRSIQVPTTSQSTTSDTPHVRQQPINNRVVRISTDSLRTITPRTPCVILPSV